MPNAKMKMLLSFPVLGACLLGCSSKPKTSPAREPAAPELAAPAPAPEAQPPQEDARRQRMLRRAQEVFRTVYFPYDQDILDDQAKRTLADIRGFLMEYPEVSVSVEGHADERGTNEYNLALGDRRAHAVSTYLTGLGVPQSLLKTVSFGEEKPAREGHSEGEWKLNRRAEFAPVL